MVTPMASSHSTSVDESIMKLHGAPDEDIGIPKQSTRSIQAMQIGLARETVKEMQRHLRSGKTGIQLMLGKSPSLRYGNVNLPLRITPTTFRTEVYEEENKENLQFKTVISHCIATKKAEEAIASIDVGLAQLQERLATIAREKEDNKATFISGVRDPKKMDAKKVPTLLRKSGAQKNIGRSVPASPAIAASATSNAHSSTLQVPHSNTALNRQLEAYKISVLHLLALKPIKQQALASTTGVPNSDCLTLLRKFGDLVGSENVWKLSDRGYKSLDVWKFPYASSEERQLVIDNAIRALDRQRVPPNDKVWELFLPVEERGKNKILSKLNILPSATTVKAPAVCQPKNLTTDTLTKSENMARTKSLDSMAWKKNESEAKIKGVISQKKAPPKKKEGIASDTPKAENVKEEGELAGSVDDANDSDAKKDSKKVTKVKPITKKQYKSAETIVNSDEDDEVVGVKNPSSVSKKSAPTITVKKVITPKKSIPRRSTIEKEDTSTVTKVQSGKAADVESRITNVGLGITLGKADAVKDDERQEASKNEELKETPTLHKDTAKVDAIATDSSAISMSSMSADATPMERQSSSQSSISVNVSKVPILRKRAVDYFSDAETPPMTKKSKNDSPSNKVPDQAMSSPLSDAQSVSTPSALLNSGDQTIGTSAATDSKAEALEPLERQVRELYAAFISRRRDHDLAEPDKRPGIESELQAAAIEIERLEKVLRPLAFKIGGYERFPGLPRGVKIDSDVLNHCREKLAKLTAGYIDLRQELTDKGEEYPEDEVIKLKRMHIEIQELSKIVFPVTIWNSCSA